MDGKKRIARLRNIAGWKKDIALGFQARAGPAKKGEEMKPVFIGIPLHPVNDDVKSVGLDKKSVFASARSFCEALEKRGFKMLGSGAYSSVYAKDGYDKVIKVSRCLDNWIDYILWASKAGYAGSFAPKVYSWKRFKKPGKRTKDPWGGYSRWDETEWSVAIVERMKETLNADSHLARDFKIIERIHDLSRKSLLAELIMDEIVPGVGKFFKELHQTMSPSDVYGKNLMIRADGTFCVTDPVCGSIKTEAMRFRAGDFSRLNQLLGDFMRKILFSLSKDIQTRPAIIDGEPWRVYCQYNKELQHFELMLAK